MKESGNCTLKKRRRGEKNVIKEGLLRLDVGFCSAGRDSVLTSGQAGGMQAASWLLRPEPAQRTPMGVWGKAGALLGVPADRWGRISRRWSTSPRDRREPVCGNVGGRRAQDREGQPPMSAPSSAAPQRQAAADVCTEAGHVPHLSQEDRIWLF